MRATACPFTVRLLSEVLGNRAPRKTPMEWLNRLLGRKVKKGQQVVEPQNRARKPKLPLAERLAARLASAQRNARNTKECQLQAGIYEYRWRSSGDVRICAACATNDGKHFLWTSHHHMVIRAKANAVLTARADVLGKE